MLGCRLGAPKLCSLKPILDCLLCEIRKVSSVKRAVKRSRPTLGGHSLAREGRGGEEKERLNGGKEWEGETKEQGREGAPMGTTGPTYGIPPRTMGSQAPMRTTGPTYGIPPRTSRIGKEGCSTCRCDVSSCVLWYRVGITSQKVPGMNQNKTWEGGRVVCG